LAARASIARIVPAGGPGKGDQVKAVTPTTGLAFDELYRAHWRGMVRVALLLAPFDVASMTNR
jgi:hypothetical protein